MIIESITCNYRAKQEVNIKQSHSVNYISEINVGKSCLKVYIGDRQFM